ncbi:hypothetical protein WJ968_34200 [Achromobacter xylosoxidans]
MAGPGTLEISAYCNILMLDQAAVLSMGPVVPGDTRPGAGIAMQAGLGAQGADYAGFLRRYLDPSRVADPSRPLTDQGLPFKTYEHELLLWLTQVYGFAGNTSDARAYFDALPPEQQRVFARQIYFAELRAGAREYNAKSSPRLGSFLRAHTPSPLCSRRAMPAPTMPAASPCMAARACRRAPAATSRC